LKTLIDNYFNWIWYQTSNPPLLLKMLSCVYKTVIALRRNCYQSGLFKSTRVAVPVIVVGNLSVGGTGKTPLTIWLVCFLRELGYQPGVISRGYTGQATHRSATLVSADSDPRLYGDEAVLIATRTQCPVVVAKQRVAAAQHLLAISQCDIIISDDGLQHLALKRDIEIIVIDGMRQFGNRYCLPAGPLREPVSRIDNVDFLVCNGSQYANAIQMTVAGNTIVNLIDQHHQRPLSSLRNQHAHVVTAIGNPQRFFQTLKQAGITFDTRVFPDHHHYSAKDLYFDDNYPLVMTEKDAVKCYHLANKNTWMLPVQAQLDTRFNEALRQLLEKKHGRCKIA
jgi:tetraacyldisaccharide 4'-kinase